MNDTPQQTINNHMEEAFGEIIGSQLPIRKYRITIKREGHKTTHDAKGVSAEQAQNNLAKFVGRVDEWLGCKDITND